MILRSIIAWLKGVINRMFGISQMRRATGAEVTLSGEMLTRMELWDNMMQGKAPWCETASLSSISPGVESQGLEGTICLEFSNTVLSEMDTHVDNEIINEIYQKGIKKLNRALQDGLATGSLVIKPIGTTGEVEFISQDRMVPHEWNADGTPKWIDFIEVKPVGNNDVYYRIEGHRLSDAGLTITNRAFRGADGQLGREVPLSTFEEWADLPAEVTYPGMDRLDFGYYVNPLPNRIDGSHSGVSIFEPAVLQIRKCDIQAYRLDWEMESGERAIFADYTAFKREERPGTKAKSFIPKGKERMYVGVDEDDIPITPFSPEFRDANQLNVLNEYRREVEEKVSLAFGDLSREPESVAKTATEILASKIKKFNMVNAIQNNLKDALEGFAWGIAFYTAQFNSGFEVVTSFKDSVITDEDKERNNDRLDLAAGIMSPIEYRMKWYGEDEATATAMLPVQEVPAGNGEEMM